MILHSKIDGSVMNSVVHAIYTFQHGFGKYPHYLFLSEKSLTELAKEVTLPVVDDGIHDRMIYFFGVSIKVCPYQPDDMLLLSDGENDSVVVFLKEEKQND